MKVRLHPGEFIARVYLEPLGVSSIELANRLCVSASTVSRLINCKIDLSYEMAVRLSTVLGRTPESWINLQTEYSLNKILSEFDSSKLKPIKW